MLCTGKDAVDNRGIDDASHDLDANGGPTGVFDLVLLAYFSKEGFRIGSREILRQLVVAHLRAQHVGHEIEGDVELELVDRLVAELGLILVGGHVLFAQELLEAHVHAVQKALVVLAHEIDVVLDDGAAGQGDGMVVTTDKHAAATVIDGIVLNGAATHAEAALGIEVHAAAIAAQMEQLDVFDDIQSLAYETALEKGLITLMGKETDDKFLAHVLAQINDKASVAKVADTFTMVYTPFHGTGYQQIPYVLGELGIRHLHCVPEQMVIDGTFPTVKSPNPETPESFALALDLAKKVNADLILGSDPDADRVAIQVKDKNGQYVQISGNQTGVLLLDYLIGAKKRAGTLPADAVALKSLVTTDMARVVAEANGVKSYNTFTGFKFMAEKKNQLEAAGQGHVIFSYEESIGYMIGDYVRDKDAVTASLLLTEMTAWYAAQGMTLLDALDALYTKYGYYGEKTLNLVMPGLEGMALMANLMAKLRQTPPTEIAGTTVLHQKDYQDGTERDTASGAVSPMALVGSNVLAYDLADETTLVVRPSGTEPKIKVYVLAKGKDSTDSQEKVAKYTAWAETLKELAK